MYYIHRKNSTEKGFTLIEMMVSVSVFSIVMLVAVGALLTIVDANRKAQAIKSVTNNLNFALESMSRTIRTGTSYYCGSTSDFAPFNTTQDCPNGGGTLLAFEGAQGDKGDSSDQIVYRLHGAQIERSLQGGVSGTFVPITDSQVQIQKLEFYVVGSSAGDNVQPRVFIIIQGVAGSSERSQTTFNLQTSVTQRLLDF